MVIFYMILGLISVYSIIHFIIIQFMKNWKDRSGYERFITILGIVFIFLFILSIVQEN
jgi:hypothetical protein